MELLSTGEIAIRLGAALFLGGLVGLERERKNRPAGFRTMILIGLGSAGFVLLGTQAIFTVAQDLTEAGVTTIQNARVMGQAEISRVIQGLIGGVGFLGAGAVIQNKKAVRGVTTAAAVWVTAAIGAACGLGLYRLAGLLSVMALFTLIILEFFENKYFPDPVDSKDSASAGPNDRGSNTRRQGEIRLNGDTQIPVQRE